MHPEVPLPPVPPLPASGAATAGPTRTVAVFAVEQGRSMTGAKIDRDLRRRLKSLGG